ncbi:peptidyl-prolyl cis-trans isomerase D [Parabacteroides sp. PFB2-12]|uniref:peptidylprolyl isomerase n=1 Tax=unclassified Parabacteroides TaxID=2649774 RepID=UPI0024766EFB|nr:MULTISPECIES: SurA N-terminal domain-containing protein [unclassified Parabacteroides]MDH6341300.1 peptidyl-prolyl cis-trans isomerase D [Parabacteroides sp. PM6-13]MDH6389092.1 peptidyl-prolyl cis-trans isomerase D [Parabacteroides sp. PFB2-12]
MATLEKIRSKAGLLIIVVGVALFAFIIGDFLNSGSTYFRQTQEKIASVNGEVISIQDYQARMDEMIEVYKMQSGNANLTDELNSQVRESVFQSMVREMVLGEETDKLGMVVSPEELFDMVQGENISPMLQQMPMFMNEAGQFDKTALLNFLKMIDDDNIANYPVEQQAQLLSLRNFWLFWEKNLKSQRLEEKYLGLMTKAISANALDAKDHFEGNSNTSDIAYVMQPYSTIPDSTITISKGELEKLYNQRKETYKQTEAKVINYIAVDIVPSAEDFAKVSAEIESVKPEFASTTNVAEVVNEYSDNPYLDAFFSASAFTGDEDLKHFVTTANVGDVEGPLFSGNTYRMFRLVDKVVAPDSVNVSHIMLAGMTDEQTAALADSLVGVLKNKGDFAELAAQYSVDQSAQAGGLLGWFTEATALRGVNEDFKTAVFSANAGDIKVVKSMYGTHIVKVNEKTSNVDKYKVANISMTVSPSSQTYSNLYNNLNQYISVNNTQAKFDENAQEAGYNLVSNFNLGKNDQTLGLIKNSRQVVRWAFQSKKGDMSDIFECDDKFVVAVMLGTIPEGYRSLASVTPILENELRAQKKGAIIAEQLKSKNLSSLEDYAAAMNNATIEDVKFVGFNTSRISGVGAEPKINAMAAVLPEGKVSEPIIGNNGVYVIKVVQKNKAEGEYNEAEQMASVNGSNAYRFSYQTVQELIDQAEVVDNRVRFY